MAARDPGVSQMTAGGTGSGGVGSGGSGSGSGGCGEGVSAGMGDMCPVRRSRKPIERVLASSRVSGVRCGSAGRPRLRTRVYPPNVEAVRRVPRTEVLRLSVLCLTRVALGGRRVLPHALGGRGG